MDDAGQGTCKGRVTVLLSTRNARIVMSIRSLTGFLAIVLTTACASFYRMPIPSWERYQRGDLAGFVYAPGEHVVDRVPGIAVRQARGRVEFPAERGAPLRVSDPLRPSPTVRTEEHGEPNPVDLKAIDGAPVFVVELRGPGSSDEVRTVATGNGVFDFGPLPNGTYTFKATVLRCQPVISTITVSDSADAAARIRIVFVTWR